MATAACLGALAFAAAIDARSGARATYRVTVTAQLTKTWNYASASLAGECTTTTRVVGNRVVTLRSTRPALVRVTGSPGRVAYSPTHLRGITARTTQDGSVTTTERGVGCARQTHVDCARRRRTLTNHTLRFYRSRPGELSSRRSRDFGAGLPGSCPPEHRDVQIEQPGMHEAQGGISERQLFDARFESQAVTGSFTEETEIEGAIDGRVLERVTWTLRFVRVY